MLKLHLVRKPVSAVKQQHWVGGSMHTVSVAVESFHSSRETSLEETQSPTQGGETVVIIAPWWWNIRHLHLHLSQSV